MVPQVVLFLSYLCIGVVLSVNVPLTMLTDSKAKCLDGTQSGFYYQQARSVENQNKWVINLNGGGECDTESACVAQTKSSLGSSKYFYNQSDAAYWYLASDNCAANPDLCNWNHVLNPYCTQDLHSGMVETASNETYGLYFAGFFVMESILNSLDKAENSILSATDIIVHGVSAGGIGVWMVVDYIAKRYPKARVVAAPLAGHYFYATYYAGENHTSPSGMGDFRAQAWEHTYALYNAYVDEDCKAAYLQKNLSPGACLLSNNSLPYIQSEVFITQALTDQVVLTG
ncbi:hypothetical protein EON65_08590 [archaeon]|nr:MAG: hypothetical protein EON65_08590 [archaeon]